MATLGKDNLLKHLTKNMVESVDVNRVKDSAKILFFFYQFVYLKAHPPKTALQSQNSNIIIHSITKTISLFYF